MESLEQFVEDLLDGSLKPFVRSDPVPEKNEGLVKVRDIEFSVKGLYKCPGLLTEG